MENVLTALDHLNETAAAGRAILSELDGLLFALWQLQIALQGPALNICAL